MRKFLLTIILSLSLFSLSACQSPKADYFKFLETDKIKVVATTTMMGDMISEIGGNKVYVYTMMSPGVDPHTYSPNKLDIDYLLNADVVLLSGLHLEAKIGDAIKHVQNKNINVIEATNILIEKHLNNHEEDVYLLDWSDIDDESSELYDPHFWFNVNYWMIVASDITNQLIYLYPEHASYFQLRYDTYLNELLNLNIYIETRINEIPQDKRILFTAHDAFNYFGNRYGFQVEGVQGLSTEYETNTADIERLVELSIAKNVNTVFIETSVPKKTIDALIESAKSKNHHLSIGGELFSDSLGKKGENGGTYIKMIKDNVDTIVDAIIKNQ